MAEGLLLRMGPCCKGNWRRQERETEKDLLSLLYTVSGRATPLYPLGVVPALRGSGE